MGSFLIRQVDRESGAELGRFAAGNVLAYEGIEHVYRQIFPPYHAPMSFKIGVCGATVSYPDSSPNPAGGASFGPELTFADCTGPAANEGGCYTDAMRSSFGYSRRSVNFIAGLEADGGAFASQEVVFPNHHEWTPQPASDWDLPWTADEIEQPPPEWTPKESWEPVVGYPWQRPRKRCGTVCNPDDENDCVYSYMHTWDDTGELDWLCDFRMIGGFPVTLAFLFDAGRDKLVAAAQFRTPVLLRPGTSLYVMYRARIAGRRLSRDFALRFAQFAFARGGSRYDAILCRPVLAEAPKINRRTTYNELAGFFDPDFGPVPLASWTFVAGPPPHVVSATVPQWVNKTTRTLGPFGGLAVYGAIGASSELMWFTPTDTPVSVPAGDTLRVPDGVKFQLDGV